MRAREAPDMLASMRPKFVAKQDRLSSTGQEDARGAPKQPVDPLAIIRRAGERHQSQMQVDYGPALTLTEADRQVIAERYLGGAKEAATRRLRRFGDRRLLFEWDAADDTSARAERGTPPAPSSASSSSGRGAPPLAARGEERVVRAVDAQGLPIEVHIPYRGADGLGAKGVGVAPSRGALAEGAAGRLPHRRAFDDRHWREKGVAEMTERDWRIFKEDFGIAASGSPLPRPIRYWDECAPSILPPALLRLLLAVGYKEPTPIQRQTIPIIMEGRDLIGIAETGSGKTASFVLPMLAQILSLPPMTPANMQGGPYGMILAPTRELALQIEQETRKFCLPLKLNCTAIVGGHSMAEQSVSMRRGVEIVIATPGRLRDCLEQHVLALNQCFRIVLDEADRMIDMNYEEDLAYILSALPQVDPEQMEETDGALPEQASRRRQTTMFSATMPLALDKLARTFLHRPATVTVGETGQAAATVEQRLVMVKEEEKERQLLKILDSRTVEPPIIIFVNTKKTVDAVCRRLESFGHRCVALHGGKNQNQREAAITQVRGSGRDILVATDVAGRGIDIPDVSLVINFDMSKTIEDYIHRIGRTGRAGKRGIAITLLTVEDSEMYYDLRAILEKAPRTAPLPQEFLTHEATRIKPGTVSQKRRHEERIFAYGL